MLAFVGCGPSFGVSPPDAGIGPNVTLTTVPIATVVIGESSSINVTIASLTTSPQSLTINTSPLPDGVTCSSAFTSTDTTTVTITFHASADAAISEIPIDVIASSDGKILASTPLTLDVSAVTGSLDPKFGNAGIVGLPNGADNPTAIGVAQDETIIVTGFGENRIFIERFAPSATPGAPWQYGSNASTNAAAIADDGHVAFEANDTSAESIIEVDATNTLAFSGQVPGATALAWDGSDLFVGTPSSISRLGPSGTSTLPTATNITSLETTAPGSVLAAGIDTNDHPTLTTFTVAGTTLDATPSIVPTTQQAVVTNTVTTSKGTLVGLASAASASVLRLDSQDAVIATYTLGAQWSRATHVLALPNGEPILLGLAQLQVDASTNILPGYIQGFDVAFGALGHTYLLGAFTVVAGAIDPTGKYLYVTGTSSGQSQMHAWVARIRLTSTP